ncbi:hypothetical protein DM02DRAFT_700431 [Periconia macrospinosa]|uniref:Uncharacterized protein n=1 Tax=Periconia macrospinosa TaxID=97972 RepID=A0A2V1EBR4_9PLEO|nr:hypothetical protein DM02DRAFT_700431 [Periconia macrospinosa]
MERAQPTVQPQLLCSVVVEGVFAYKRVVSLLAQSPREDIFRRPLPLCFNPTQHCLTELSYNFPFSATPYPQHALDREASPIIRMGAYHSSMHKPSRATTGPSQVPCGSANKHNAGRNDLFHKQDRKFYVRFGGVASPILTTAPLILQCVNNIKSGAIADDPKSIDWEVVPTLTKKTQEVFELEAPVVILDGIESHSCSVIYAPDEPTTKSRSASSSSTALSTVTITTTSTHVTNVSDGCITEVACQTLLSGADVDSHRKQYMDATSCLEEERRQYGLQIKKLESKITGLQAHEQEVTNQNLTLTAHLQVKLNELQQQHQAELAKKDEEIVRLELGNRLLRSNIARSNTEKDSQTADLTKQLHTMQISMNASHTSFQARCDEMEAANQNLSYQLVAKDQFINGLHGVIEEKNKELELTKQELQRTKTDYQTAVYIKTLCLNRIISQKHALAGQRRNLATQNQNLEAQRQKLEELNDQLAKKDQWREGLDKIIEDQRTEVDRYKEDITTATQLRVDLDTELAAKNVEVKTLRDQLKNARANHNSAHIAAKDQKTKYLSSKLKKTRKRYRTLRNVHINKTKNLNSVTASVPQENLEKASRDLTIYTRVIPTLKLQVSQKRQKKEYAAGMVQQLQLLLAKYPDSDKHHQKLRLQSQSLEQTRGRCDDRRRREGDTYFNIEWLDE